MWFSGYPYASFMSDASAISATIDVSPDFEGIVGVGSIRVTLRSVSCCDYKMIAPVLPI